MGVTMPLPGTTTALAEGPGLRHHTSSSTRLWLTAIAGAASGVPPEQP